MRESLHLHISVVILRDKLIIVQATQNAQFANGGEDFVLLCTTRSDGEDSSEP